MANDNWEEEGSTLEFINSKWENKMTDMYFDEDIKMKESEVLEFLKSDLGFMVDSFNQAIEHAEEFLEGGMEDETVGGRGYIAGLKAGLQIARTWYDIRLDEGF